MKKCSILAVMIIISYFYNVLSLDTNRASFIDKKDFNPSTILWYDSAATKWEEALPVGNGRLGAMVFGKYGEERIQLNEETYWSGGPYSTIVKGGYQYLPEIQKLIFEGEPIKAHKLFGRYIMGYPVEQQKYQSLANLLLFFKDESKVTDYKRWLDLETAITYVEYTVNEVTYKREIFSSAPDQAILIRLTCDKPGSISFRAQLRGCRNQAHSNYATDYFRMDGAGQDGLLVTGKSADYLGIEGKIRYRAQLKAIPEGGSIRVDDIDLIIENADAVTLCFVAATNFVNYKDVSADQNARVASYLNGIEGKSYISMREAAIKDYQNFFNRVALKLAITENAYLPTDKRIARFVKNAISYESRSHRLSDGSLNPLKFGAKGSKTDASLDSVQASANYITDPSMASLCYNFGRYLLISSSRPGTEAANLQGIWNENMNPNWDSKYTTNINTEMNYWPVESANLSELAEPLITLVKELTDQGAQVAKEGYGARGWVFHQNTDIWRVAAPMDGPTWGTFTVGGAWLTTQLWEHYLFTLDKDYLKDIYPVIKGSVEFFMDFLVEHPNGRWLVTNPSNSPENPPKGPGYRYFYDEVTGMYYFTTICAGSSMDMQILTDLFAYYIESTKMLGIDKEFAEKVSEARKRLVPPQIGQDGSLQEWTDDWQQMEEKHRHFSHMYGLYPGNVISAKRTPQLVDPVKAVLEQRGDGGTGFSRGWKMALWARLYDGERAYNIFKGYLKDQAYPQLFAKCYTALQVDGTFGVTAGLTEMLVQSHEGVIDLLPALPTAWSQGEFNGVCTRGAFELNMQWAESKISKVEVLSKAGQICRINPGVAVVVNSDGKKVNFKKNKDGSIEFPTTKGVRYYLQKIL